MPLSAQQDVSDTASDPLKMDFELTDKFVPSGPGVYKIVATGLTAFAQSVTATRSFMVVGAGGTNNTIQVGTPPEIVSTTPVADAQGVPVNSFVQVLFSEPVTNIPGHISLVPDDGSAPPPLQLSGINYQNGSVISTLGPADAVSSLTIQPVAGLKFGMHYTIQVTSDIKDLDNVADPTKLALGLVPPASPISFTTFGPQVLGGTAPFSSTRAVVLGNRAYVAVTQNGSMSTVKGYDISDPANPVEVNIGAAGFIGRAQDTAGEENVGVLNGGNLLAVGAGIGGFLFQFGIPSNLWLYNVSGDQIQRVGAVSVTGSTVNEGQLLRVTLHGNFAYSGTFPLGIQVVDLQRAIQEYTDVFSTNPTQFGVQVTTDGEGFARDAVVNTIPVKDSNGRNFMVFGIKGGEFIDPTSDPANPSTQTYIVATGIVPGALPNQVSFVVADPASSAPPAYAGTLQLGTSSLDAGTALVLGELTDSIPDASGNLVQKPVAVVVGRGTASDPANSGTPSAGGVLAVVDMTNPRLPVVLSMLKLETFPTDVVLHDTTALVGTGENKVLLVNLNDPRHPASAGEIDAPPGTSLGDHLAISDSGFLITSSLNGTIGGIHTATLGPFIQIREATAQIKVDDNGNSVDPVQVTVNALGQADDLKNAQLIYSEDGVQKTAIPLGDLRPGVQIVTIPPGLHMTSSSQLVTLSMTKSDGTQTEPVQMPIVASNSTAALNTQTAASTSATDSSASQTSSSATGSDSGGAVVFVLPFTSMSPSSITVGAGDTVITVQGVPAGLKQVQIHGMDGQWHTIDVTSTSGSIAQFTIPAALLSQAGFLEAAILQSDASSMPIMVADPSLPVLESGDGFDPLFVDNDYEDVVAPHVITVGGANFTTGMSIVLGRGTTPGVVLPTTFLSPNALQATIPVPFAAQADDLFVAILSQDKTLLSSAIPYPRPNLVTLESSADPADSDLTVTNVPLGIDPDEAASVTRFDPTETGITSINGVLVETIGAATDQPQQFLTINGANLSDGMQVNFSTIKGGQPLNMSAPLTGTQVVASLTSSNDLPPVSATTLMQARVAVPKAIVDTTISNIQVKSSNAKSNIPTVSADPPTVVPFGGKVEFQVYQEPGGEYHVEATSRAPVTYQPVTNAVITISKSAPNPGGFPTIQLEREQGDPTYKAGIRGTALTELPCKAIAALNLNPPVSCNATVRPFAQVQATLNGNVIATHDVKSMPTPLGRRALNYDSLAQFYGDLYGVPPQYLKSQAIQESRSFTTNFRFEFTTINVACLSGDLGVRTRVCDGSDNIPREPWSHYVINGRRLGPYRPRSADRANARVPATFAFDPGDPANVTFSLNVSVKRTVGGALTTLQPANGGVESSSVVRAAIQNQNGTRVRALTQVHLENVWQKSGHGQTFLLSHGVSTQANVCDAGVNVNTATLNLAANQFAICYSTGQIFLGSPLQAGQRLAVDYWPVQPGVQDNRAQDTVINIPLDGDLIANAPNLNSRQIVRGLNQLQYSNGQSLSDFLQTNVAHGKGFLTGTLSDMRIEFTADQNNKPVRPRDPRYQFMTAQPYASSSFGFFQLTLLAFSAGSPQVGLNQAFNPGYSSGPCPLPSGTPCPAITPLYQLISEPQTNFDLAGRFHRISYGTFPAGTFCDSTNSCNNNRWQIEWSQVINQFNRSGNGYTVASPTSTSLIVRNGDALYAPQNPNVP